MPQKTKIIFIIVFITVGAIMLGVYFYNTKNNTNTDGTKTSLVQKFNPFGTSTKNPNIVPSTTTTGDNSATTTDPNLTIGNGSRLNKITDFAVAGAVFFEDTRPLPPKDQAVEVVAPVVTPVIGAKKVVTKVLPVVGPTSEIVPSLRYVEKATGHVYQMYLDTKIEGKISNSTIPAVYETIFDGKAGSIIYRYPSSDNKSITSFLASLGGKDSAFLSSDILDISLSPDKSSFFSIIKNTKGVIGTTKSFDETKTNQVFSSSFSEWLPQWVTDQSIFLTTRPSYMVEGSIFSLNIKTGILSKIFGGVVGLTTLSNNDGTSILYGASLNTGPKLNIFNIKDHTSIDLGVYGLPEKCIWSSDNINVYCAIPNTIVGTQYPDSWYQGQVSFDDRFVKINTQTKEVITLANSTNDVPIDGIKLFLSKSENKLFLINKKDYKLWSLDLQ
jgi:hypothetical protein